MERKREVLIKILARISYFSGITFIFQFLNRDRKKILAYHNVIPDKFFDNKLHLAYSHRESSFGKQLDIIKNSYRIDLDIKNRKSITLTFDDGYQNQFQIASKILDKYGLKGIFFFSGSLIENGQMFALDKMDYWFSYVPLGNYGGILNIEEEEDRAGGKEKYQKNFSSAYSQEELLEKLNEFYPFEKFRMPNKEYMQLRFDTVREENVKEMAEKGHLIGAHSYFHKRLSELDETGLEEDIEKCRNLLQRKVYNTAFFCYPFGSDVDIDDKVIEKLEKKGFTKGFAYTNVKNKREFGRYFIPRMILPDTDDQYVIKFFISGTRYFLSSFRRLPRWEE